MKLLLQPAGIAGWKFDSSQRDQRCCAIGFMLDRDRILPFNFEFPIRGGGEVPKHRFRQERDITEPALGPFIDAKTFGSPKVAVD